MRYLPDAVREAFQCEQRGINKQLTGFYTNAVLKVMFIQRAKSLSHKRNFTKSMAILKQRRNVGNLAETISQLINAS